MAIYRAPQHPTQSYLDHQTSHHTPYVRKSDLLQDQCQDHLLDHLDDLQPGELDEWIVQLENNNSDY